MSLPSCYHMLLFHIRIAVVKKKVFSLINNYKGLVQLKMSLMSCVKQNCSTAFDVLAFKANCKLVFSIP